MNEPVKKEPWGSKYWYSPVSLGQEVDKLGAGFKEEPVYFDQAPAEKVSQTLSDSRKKVGDQIKGIGMIPQSSGLGKMMAQQATSSIGEKYKGSGARGLAEALKFGQQSAASGAEREAGDASSLHKMRMAALLSAGQNRAKLSSQETESDKLMSARELARKESGLGWAGLNRAASNTAEDFYLKWLLIKAEEDRIANELARQKGILNEDFWWNMGIGLTSAAAAAIPGIGMIASPAVAVAGQAVKKGVQG